MASFTDTQLPRFNPYIQQQPVEAMVAVGTQKQKGYEEGVQKIQTQVDNIAGLDVANDVGRAYLQSKMNELGNRLRTVAAGDFSNFQFVNSVSGMTKQLIRDPGVQNAVNSTAKLRKEQAFMEEERKAGTLNPSNEFVFNKQASTWFNSDDVLQGFNAKYDKFFDVDKHMRETFDAIKPDGYTIDDIYVKDPVTGKHKTGRDGKLILSPTMTRLKKEGKFPEKVKATLDHVMKDPRVSKQLNIDGQYSYRGVDPQTLAKRITKSKTDDIERLDDGITDLRIRLNTTKDPKAKADIQAEIDKFEGAKTETIASYDSLYQTALENPDTIRGMLYSDEARRKFQDMYTSVHKEELVMDNPEFKIRFEMSKHADDMMMRREGFKIQYAQMAQAKELAYAGMENQMRIAQLKAEGKKKPGDPGYGEGGEDISMDFMPTDLGSDEALEKAFDAKGARTWDNYAKSTDELIFASGILTTDSLEKFQKQYPNATPEEARRAVINATAKAKGISPSAYRALYADKAVKAMNKNPQGMSNYMRELKNTSEVTYNQMQEYLTQKKQVDAGVVNPEQRTKNLKNISFEKDGRRLTLDPQAQYDVAIIADTNKKGVRTTTPEVSAIRAAAVARLKQKGIEVNDVPKLMLNAKFSNAPGTKEFSNLVSKGVFQDYATNTKNRAANIRKFGMLNPIGTKAAFSGVDKDDNPLKERLKGYIADAVSNKQNLSANVTGNAEKFAEIIADKTKGTVSYKFSKDERTGEIKTVAVFSDAKLNKVGEFTLNADQSRLLGNNPEAAFKSGKVKTIEEKMNIIGNGTTSYYDVSSRQAYEGHESALLKNDFNNLKKYPGDVKANIRVVTNVDDDGRPVTSYLNYIYINNNGRAHIYEYPIAAPSLDQAVEALRSISPEMVNRIVREVPPQ